MTITVTITTIATINVAITITINKPITLTATIPKSSNAIQKEHKAWQHNILWWSSATFA